MLQEEIIGEIWVSKEDEYGNISMYTILNIKQTFLKLALLEENNRN